MDSTIKRIRIGVIGDVIIDKYKYYRAIKLSPEGPAPIVKSLSESLSLGGAANVAISMSNLGLDVDLIYGYSLNQKDENYFLKNKANKYSFNLIKVESHISKPIPIKIRYYVDGKQFMREDLEEINITENNLFSDKFIMECIENYDILVISDYQKGLLSFESIKKFINCCNSNNIPLFIDTKTINFENIKDSFCLKINETEFNNLFVRFKLNYEDSLSEITQKIDAARKFANIKNLILTLGSQGSFLSNTKETINIKPEPVEVVDITGAGDAFLAGIVYSFSKNNFKNNLDSDKNFITREDLRFGNCASGSVIAFKGTEPISKDFLKLSKEKYLKKKVGFTNGCFDLLHDGHLSLLKKSKENCDYLIVGLNSDESIKNLKGENRPINSQQIRFQILNAIKYVDEVIIFEENTPLNLIKKISPDLLIKGEDYLESEIVGADFVRSYGGETMRVKLIPNKSTTNLLKKIQKSDPSNK